MEASKNTQFKKRRDTKLQTIYSRCLLTRKLVFPIVVVGKNLDDVIEDYIQNHFEGKCVVEGYIKKNSSKIIRYSSGVIQQGNKVVFEVVFECDICLPVEGMLMTCTVTNVTKAGVRAEIGNESPTPVVAFVSKDHHFNIHHFNEIQVGDTITVRVVGQRFELNDKFISVIGEYVKEKEYVQKPKQPVKPRIVIEK
jgi:DNA-directed RNA polymerase subunit E'/Rpb7